ncbi:uncharacterized protein TNCV_2497681 [Trichonephila clavipes]|nr:uncharacterized protein TNCV_2497681 [Trichonephila clavipes]
MSADDTAILSRHKNLNTLVENINEHLAHLEIWFSVWKIALNTSKTEAVFFSQRVPPPEITLQNQRIPWSHHTKYLGVYLDKTLTFRQHITQIRTKFKNVTHKYYSLICRKSKLSRQRDENGDIIRIWLKFPKSCGRKQATKLRNLSARLNLDDDAVPITSQTSSVSLNNNKTIIAKRKHFPLVSALAMTIHKSQGGTYDAIVYEYDRKHPRELVYVALSRVTKIEGLFMVTKENTEDSWKFWIGRSGIPLNASESDKHLKRSTSHREDLTLELKRLKNNTLQTVTQTFLEFISNKKGLSIFSFNCQSLHAHVTDLKNDAIVKKSNVLLLSETRMKNEEPIHIPDFNFVASYKRPEVPAAGVAIYQHTQDTSHIVTSYMDIHTKFTRGIGVNVSDIGEICVARCNSENGQYILMVAVYISPEKSMQQIEQFLFENLMIYTKEGSELLEKRFGEKFDDIPMILSGDFNINFADDKNLSLIEFLNETLGLTMSNDRKSLTFQDRRLESGRTKNSNQRATNNERDAKIHASKLRLLACRRPSNCNDLLPNMKTQRSAMSLDFCQIRD